MIGRFIEGGFLLCLLLVCGGCGNVVEVVRFENDVITEFYTDFDMDAPGLKGMCMGEMLVVPYFSQNPSWGCYDLRVALWSHEKSGVKIEHVSIEALGIDKSADLQLHADKKEPKADLYLGNGLLVEGIDCGQFYRDRGENPVVEVRILLDDKEVQLEFSYSFNVRMERIAAPIR